MTRATGYRGEHVSVERLRSLHEVEDRHRELSQLLADPPSSYDTDALEELRGASDALAWVCGLVVEAPISGAVVVQPLHPDALWGEYDVAERVALPNAFPDYSAPARARSLERAYVLGVRDALRWVVAE